MFARRSIFAYHIARRFCASLDKDLYNILGISSKASKLDIKLAYAGLVKKHHPDVTKGDDAKFKDINLAYSVLGNEEKKKDYDAYVEQKEKVRNFNSGSGNTTAGVDLELS